MSCVDLPFLAEHRTSSCLYLVTTPRRAVPNGARICSAGQDDLLFHWLVKPAYNFDVFNVRARVSDGREDQVEWREGSGIVVERNAGVGMTDTFLVQGCDPGTFGSKCTAWSQIRFRSVRGNDAADGA